MFCPLKQNLQFGVIGDESSIHFLDGHRPGRVLTGGVLVHLHGEREELFVEVLDQEILPRELILLDQQLLYLSFLSLHYLL